MLTESSWTPPENVASEESVTSKVNSTGTNSDISQDRVRTPSSWRIEEYLQPSEQP